MPTLTDTTTTESIKSPVTYSQFAKNPLTAMLFMAIIGLSYFVIVMKNDCDETRERLVKVESELKQAWVMMSDIKADNAALRAKLTINNTK
jgi:hypothetical protein